jgi:hypothetical protein
VAKPSCTWQLEVKVQSEKLKTMLRGEVSLEVGWLRKTLGGRVCLLCDPIPDGMTTSEGNYDEGIDRVDGNKALDVG